MSAIVFLIADIILKIISALVLFGRIKYMSGGVFSISRYASDYNAGAEIHPIRVQPETILATTGLVDNDPPSGTLTSPISARISGSQRTLGLVARRIRLRVTGDPPATYAEGSRTTIPALTPAFYAACVKGTEVTYLGTTWEVTGRTAERVN